MAYPPIVVATTRRRNALQIVQQAMGEIGMPRPTTLAAGADETANQLLFLLNGLGERLARLPLWEATRAEWVITTTTATAYDLPEDWLVPLADTAWDRTGRWPLIGPKTPSEWQVLQSSGFGSAPTATRFRFFNGQFNLSEAPVAGQTYVYEYLSASWVIGLATVAATQADVRKYRISADTDYPLLDEQMLITGLKLAFREAKGMDSSKVQEEFEDMLEAAWANAISAKTLSLAADPQPAFLSLANIADSDYGP
jgi:hypothetical protein